MTDVLSLFSTSKVEYRLQLAEDLLAGLAAGSVQMVVTDPPYGISYQSNYCKDGKRKPISSDWNFQIGPFLQEVLRVLKPGGVCYLFTRWDVYPVWVRELPSGLELKNFIAWVKDNHSAGDLTGNFGFKWEGIMVLTKGRHQLRGMRWPNVWEFPRVPFKQQLHPAEKPVGLIRRALEASSDEGDLVVDPFAGSGATGEAARSCGRDVLLGDVDPDYVRKGRLRLDLPVDDLAPVVAPTPPSSRYTPQLCLDALEGVHPEDIAALVAHFRAST
jgi:site-specific DNA-methyltransferase (adenine-specific)